MYYLSDDFKLISDSINLNGYLVFEIKTYDKKLKIEKSQIFENNYFLTTKCYFVYNISDILNPYSIKYYYNSNRLVLDFFKFYNPKNLIEKENSLLFNSTYGKVEKKLENGGNVFRIENLNSEKFKEEKTYKFENENFKSTHFLIYKINLNSFIFSNTIKDDMNIFNNKGSYLTLAFFEPISDVFLFETVEELENFDNNFNISEKFFELFEFEIK
ncbi:MAG: hypothetical protein IAE65_03935 [Ignavibacteria bacterium]|nr:hypothetical protein [Ignavibacteria bacterium]